MASKESYLTTSTLFLSPLKLFPVDARFCEALLANSVNEAISALESGITLDAVGILIDDGLAALLELDGKRITTEVADEVFRNFCVGK